MQTFNPSDEQKRIFGFSGKKMVISASAGSGKTTTMIEYISRLIASHHPIKRMLVLTFTKAAASEMKERLLRKLIEKSDDPLIQSQIDDLFTSDISTIHSFLEKLLKRNISQFPELEGFNILDEQQSFSIKNQALEEAESELKAQNLDAYINLYVTLRDKDLARKIVLKIDDFLSAQADRAQLLKRLEDYDSCREIAEQEVMGRVQKLQDEILRQIEDYGQDEPKILAYLDRLKQLCAPEGTLRERMLQVVPDRLPSQPRLEKCAKRDEVLAIKALVQKLNKFAKKFNPKVDCVWDREQNKKLCEALFMLYELYDQKYRLLKEKSSMLDFNDLEKFSERLLQDEGILEQVQQNYDYVFIDEYQDTNPVQEKIVKLLSEQGKFIAIGDPKQGIYAFRNATSTIILNDSKAFKQMPDGATEYLSTNYRSDKEILKFVNNAFCQIMTEDSSGIDYAKSSVLSGDRDNPKTFMPPVQILIAEQQEAQKAEIAEEYDIYEDTLSTNHSSLLEAKMVASKISLFLKNDFIDPKTGVRRRVQPSDIAILARGKGPLVDGVMSELRARQIPFVSTMQSDLTTKAHTQLIARLISLCIDKRDDLALASYLYSPLCLIPMETLAALGGDKGTSFTDKVLSSQDPQICEALVRLEKFKNDCLFLGAKQALEKLFIEKEYFIYLKTQVGQNALSETQSLLSIIGGLESDKDLPLVASALNNSINVSNVSGQNAVCISTIHASKGLEYPIVFLIGTGKPIVNAERDPFKLDKDFGLGLIAFDDKEWRKYPSFMLVEAREKSIAKERVSELMVLYVALTRAKSHLVITGTLNSDKLDDFYDKSFDQIPSFLALILSTDPQSAGAKIEVIDKEEEIGAAVTKVETGVDEAGLKEKLLAYMNFEYPFLADTMIKQKSSVTALSHSGEEFTQQNDSFAREGTAYHEALKILDFESIKNASDVENQLIAKKFDENMKNLIDFSVIFENIKIIQPFIKNKKIIKEKSFSMKLEKNEGAYLVQGTVDLFLRGEKNILIDYKYSREKDAKKLLERYSKQLELYKMAIEESENIKIDEIYLLSLKNGKLIKY